MTILITGASGFLGSNIVRSFCRSGEHVVAALRTNASLSRLRGLSGSLSIVRCDQNSDYCGLVAKVQPDTIIHTACVYGRHRETFFELYKTNVDLGVTLLKTITEQNNETCKFINIDTALNPTVSPYAFTKNLFSDIGRQFAAETDCMRFINVKLQHMYGPYGDKNNFITQTIRACLNSTEDIDLTEGTQKRDFIYVEDVVSALWFIKNTLPETYCNVEVGSGQAPPLRKVVELIASLTRTRAKLKFGAVPFRKDEDMHCQADTAILRSLGWMPKFNLERGLRETIKAEKLL